MVWSFRSAKTKPDSGDVARIKALDRKIADASAALLRLEESKATIDEDIKRLEQQIIDIGGSRLLSQKSKVDGVRLHINIANDETTKAEVAKTKAEKDVAKLAASIATNRGNLDEVNAELEGLEEDLRVCVRYVNEIRSKVTDAQAAVDNSKDDLESLKAELDEKTEQIQAFRAKEVRLSYFRSAELRSNDFRWSSSKSSLILRKTPGKMTWPCDIGRLNMRTWSSSILSKHERVASSCRVRIC